MNVLIGNASRTVPANVWSPSRTARPSGSDRRVPPGARPHQRQVENDQHDDLDDVEAAEPGEVVAAREVVHELQRRPQQRPQVRRSGRTLRPSAPARASTASACCQSSRRTESEGRAGSAPARTRPAGRSPRTACAPRFTTALRRRFRTTGTGISVRTGPGIRFESSRTRSMGTLAVEFGCRTHARTAAATASTCASVSSGNIGSDSTSAGRLLALRKVAAAVSEVGVRRLQVNRNRIVHAGADAALAQARPGIARGRPRARCTGDTRGGSPPARPAAGRGESPRSRP